MKHRETQVAAWATPADSVGFTLIEPLAVIAIIAILGGRLLPALTRAKALGQLPGCKSNVKQLSLALILYVGDFQVYPMDMVKPVAFGRTAYVYEALEAYCASQWTHALYRCPAYRGDTAVPIILNGGQFQSAIGSYGYNDAGANHTGAPPGLGLAYRESPVEKGKHGHAESIKSQKLFQKTDLDLKRWNKDNQPHRENLR